ncbi:MAG: YezD family protein [Verrucomicrobiota bacterium JB022]|nr:YezD family protein [Verrucomicrobiota bacterium JB022]
MNDPSLSSPAVSAPEPGTPLPDWLELTARYVGELSYGQVTLTIHQGSVIEVQKTERTRLSPTRRK